MAAPTAVVAAEAEDDDIYCLLVCFDFVVAPSDLTPATRRRRWQRARPCRRRWRRARPRRRRWRRTRPRRSGSPD